MNEQALQEAGSAEKTPVCSLKQDGTGLRPTRRREITEACYLVEANCVWPMVKGLLGYRTFLKK